MRINDTLKSDDYAFLVCGEVGMDSEFDKWIKKEGFKGWGRKGYYCIEPHAKTWSFIDNIKCANHWRQPVESELTADFQSDWQAQLGGNGDTSGVSRMVLHMSR